MRLSRPFRYSYLAALLLCAWTSHAGVNQWTSTGPEGGLVAAVALLPSQSRVALAAAGNAVYRTTDGGGTWTRVLTGLAGTPQYFAVDPSNSNRLLVGETRVPSVGINARVFHRSEDGGVTFTSVPTPEDVFFYRLAFSADGTLLYGGIDNDGRVYVSTDRGTHWTPGSTGLPHAAADTPVALTVDPTDRETVYISFQTHGVYKSSNRGMTWAPAGLAGPELVRRIAVDPTNPARLVAATNGGLRMSPDRGASWIAVNAPVSSYGWVGFDQSDPTKVLACGGDTFCVTTTDIASPNYWQMMTGFFIGWLQDASFDAGRVLVGSSTGAQYSPDAGATFSTRNHGIGASAARQLVAARDGTVYAGFYGGLAGVYKREANGWNLGNVLDMFLIRGRQQGEPPGVGLVPDITSISVAPTASATVYALGYRGAMRTSDGGAHWSSASTQFDSVIMTQVLADPRDPQIAYATTLEEGLWRTADGGTSWEQRSNGLTDAMGPIAIDPSNSNVLYAASEGVMPQSVLYKSTDSGLHWTATGFASLRIHSLAVDPTNPAVVYAVCLDDVYRSADGGVTFQPLSTGAPIKELLIDPEVPSVLIAIGQTLTATGLRSVDSGVTWEPLGSGTFSFPTDLQHGVLDPLRPQHIIAASATNGMLEIEVAPDLRVSVESLPATLTRATQVEAIVRASNAGPFAASDVKISLSLPTWLTVSSPPSGCSVSGANLQCAVGAIRNGENTSRRITLAVADTDAAGSITASVDGHETDPDMSNDSVAQRLVAASAPPQPPANPPSSPSTNTATGGGGGSFEWMSVLALLLCGLVRWKVIGRRVQVRGVRLFHERVS